MHNSLIIIQQLKILHYSEEIVKYHQKIVQLEEELDFNDGAKSISLIYKSKYNENEESLINYSFAIMELVVKLLQLINYDSLSSAINILKTDSDKTSSYIRTRDFLLLNSNLTLRTYSEEIMEKYINMLDDKGQTGKILEIVLSSVSLGCIIILFFLILPVVFRVVSEKSKVMKGFAYVKKNEIQEILNWASAFDIRSSAKSLKLLAETRKEKVYAIIQMQKEKETIKEEEKQESLVDEASKNNKLRDLVRNIFKFDEEEEDPENKKEDIDLIENSFPSKLAYSGDNQFSSFNIEHFTPEPPMPKIEEDIRENIQNEQASVMEPILKSEKDQTQQEEEEEKILYQQKKKALSQIDVSLRRRALLKVGLIFIIFIIYSILNIVYIVMFHSYALQASNQYNDIQMRRPLMSQLILMCRQAFFENDTRYLSTQSSTRHLPEYRNWLLNIEETTLDFEKNGPHFIFPNYIDNIYYI